LYFNRRALVEIVTMANGRSRAASLSGCQRIARSQVVKIGYAGLIHDDHFAIKDCRFDREFGRRGHDRLIAR
jgi:hypothetical protein